MGTTKCLAGCRNVSFMKQPNLWGIFPSVTVVLISANSIVADREDIIHYLDGGVLVLQG